MFAFAQAIFEYKAENADSNAPQPLDIQQALTNERSRRKQFFLRAFRLLTRPVKNRP